MVKRTASQGRSVKFDCKLSSVGKVVFHWLWKGKVSNSSIDLKSTKLFGSKYIGNYTKMRIVSLNTYYFDGFLVVKDVRKEDEGTYTCIVENSHGRDEKDFYLLVTGKQGRKKVL